MTNFCMFCNCLSSEDNPVERIKVGNGFLYVCRKHLAELRDACDDRLKALSEVELLKLYAKEIMAK